MEKAEMRKAKVAILECDTYDTDQLVQKLDRGAAFLGGWEQWLKSGMTVLLKVNLIGPLPPESAAVTHCEFVRAIARIAKRQGCNVWVGDSSGGAIGGKALTGGALAVSGLQKVAEEEGLLIKNFDKEGVVEVTTAGGEKMHIARPMFDADFVINLPKFKTHMSAVFTGAFKNLFGCIPGQKKAYYHKTALGVSGFGGYICDINEAVNVGLHIIDGVIAMDRQGPTAGTVYPAHKILMGTDALAVDCAAVRMIGLDMQKMPIYQEAIRRGFGVWRPDEIELGGDYTAPPRLPGFKVPRVGGVQEAKISKTALRKIIDLLRTQPEINLGRCKHCDLCVQSCPVQAIDPATKRIDYAKCIECMCCHELCLNKAVDLVHTSRLMRAVSRIRRK